VPFPVIESTAESSVNTAGTSHAVTLPGSIAAADLVLIIMNIGSTSATLNALTDWGEILDEASANGLKILRYTGAGVPSTPTFTSSGSTRSASIACRISNANKSITPQIGTTSTGTSATPDPPASAAPPSTKDYLFIAFAGMAGEEADDDTWGNTPPTNYTPNPPLQKSCGTAGTNLGGLILAASRQLNTGSAQDARPWLVRRGRIRRLARTDNHDPPNRRYGGHALDGFACDRCVRPYGDDDEQRSGYAGRCFSFTLGLRADRPGSSALDARERFPVADDFRSHSDGDDRQQYHGHARHGFAQPVRVRPSRQCAEAGHACNSVAVALDVYTDGFDAKVGDSGNLIPFGERLRPNDLSPATLHTGHGIAFTDNIDPGRRESEICVAVDSEPHADDVHSVGHGRRIGNIHARDGVARPDHLCADRRSATKRHAIDNGYGAGVIQSNRDGDRWRGRRCRRRPRRLLRLRDREIAWRS
jgi:hypothetical protein